MSQPPALLHMEGISCSPKDRPGLHDFSMSVPEGTVVALTGANGSGLSTVGAVLAGDIGRYSGSVTVAGTLTAVRNQQLARDCGLGVVRQALTLIPNFTVAQNFRLGIDVAGRAAPHPRRGPDGSAEEVIRRYGLPLSADAPMRSLDAASQEWADIGRALYSDPRVVFLDQVEVRLGTENRQQLLDLIAQLRREGRAVVVASHDDDFIAAVADRVIRLRDGANAEDLPDAPVSRAARTDTGKSRGDLTISGTADQVVLRGGEVVALAGPDADQRRRFVAAMSGRGKPAGLAWDGDPLVLGSERAAIQSGIQTVEADQRRVGPVPEGKLSDLFTGGSASPIGRILGRSDAALSSAKRLALIEELARTGGAVPVRVVVLDRPMIGLDSQHRSEITRGIRGLAALGVLVLLSTDRACEIRELCDRALLFEGTDLPRPVGTDEAAEGIDWR